jgi:hypothetical protein
MVYKEALRQVFSEYFGFSSYQMLHFSHLLFEAGITGYLWAQVPRDSISPHPKIKKIIKNNLGILSALLHLHDSNSLLAEVFICVYE